MWNVLKRNFSLNQRDFEYLLREIKETKSLRKTITQSISDLACVLHVHHGAISARLEEIQQQTRRIESELLHLKKIMAHVRQIYVHKNITFQF